jgi:hypothetical protein
MFYGMCGTDFRMLSPKSVEANICNTFRNRSWLVRNQHEAFTSHPWESQYGPRCGILEPKGHGNVRQTEKLEANKTVLEDQVLVSMEQVFEKSKYPRSSNQNEECRKSLQWLLPRGENYRFQGEILKTCWYFTILSLILMLSDHS